MDCTVTVGELVGALSFVSTAVQTRGLVEDFQAIRLSAFPKKVGVGGLLCLQAFNGVLGLRAEVDCAIEEGGDLFVQAEKVVKYFLQWPRDSKRQVRISCFKEKSKLVFSIGRSRLCLPTFKAEKQFEVDRIQKGTPIQKDFLSYFGVFDACVHQDTTKPATCVIRISKKGRVWVLGGPTILECRFPKGLGNKESLILPVDFVHQARGRENLEIEFVENKVRGQVSGGLIFSHSTYDFEYPDVLKFLEPYRTGGKSVSLPSVLFADKFRRLAALTTNMDREIKFEIVPDLGLLLSLKVPGVDSAEEVVKCDVSFKDTRVFNSELLLDFVTQLPLFGSKTINVRFWSDHPAVVFEPTKDCLFLVLPIEKA